MGARNKKESTKKTNGKKKKKTQAEKADEELATKTVTMTERELVLLQERTVNAGM